MLNFLKIALKIITVLPCIVDCIKHNLKKVKTSDEQASDQEGGTK